MAGPAAAQSADSVYESVRSQPRAPVPAPGATAPAGDPDETYPQALGTGTASERQFRIRTRDEVDNSFRLGVGDRLQINVLEDSSLDREVVIAPDGHINVPLAGSIHAAGQKPQGVAALIRRGLSDDFIEPPSVTVSLVSLGAEFDDEANPTVYILGEVNRPGGYTVSNPVGLLQALALAGGPSLFAAKERVQIRRIGERGVEEVLLVDYEAIEDGASSPLIQLRDGDTIMIPERGLFE